MAIINTIRFKTPSKWVWSKTRPRHKVYTQGEMPDTVVTLSDWEDHPLYSMAVIDSERPRWERDEEELRDRLRLSLLRGKKAMRKSKRGSYKMSGRRKHLIESLQRREFYTLCDWRKNVKFEYRRDDE